MAVMGLKKKKKKKKLGVCVCGGGGNRNVTGARFISSRWDSSHYSQSAWALSKHPPPTFPTPPTPPPTQMYPPPAPARPARHCFLCLVAVFSVSELPLSRRAAGSTWSTREVHFRCICFATHFPLRCAGPRAHEGSLVSGYSAVNWISFLIESKGVNSIEVGIMTVCSRRHTAMQLSWLERA